MGVPSKSSGALQYHYESCHSSVEKPGDPTGNGMHCSATRTAALHMEKAYFCQAGGHHICSLEASRHEKES